MSSTFKNAVKRKTHKERSQPASRRRFGLLEKKKDYLQRAKDFHKKDNALKVLKRKAEERNPDEFYFAMQNARTKGGVHVTNTAEANKYSQEELRLMKTQDLGYIRVKAQTDAKNVERLQSNLHFIGAPRQNKHVVFVDDEQERATFDPAVHFDTPAELLDRSYNRPRTQQLQTGEVAGAARGARERGIAAVAADLERTASKAQRAASSSYRQLAQRRERHAKLQRVAQKMELDKQLMGKGRKSKRSVTVENEDGREAKATVYRWKQERKR